MSISRFIFLILVLLFLLGLTVVAVILLIRNYNKKRTIPTGTSQYIRDDAPEKRSLGEVLRSTAPGAI